MHEALHYEKTTDGVICRLCPHFCRLQGGKPGLCGVRREEGGKLYTMNYGLCGAAAVDPIEKKPLYHFYPGRKIFSVGTAGCNLDCGFCQNWQLVRADGKDFLSLTPAELVAEIMSRSKDERFGIAYTYAEPGMWFEFVLETAALAKQKGLKNVMVTNGYLNPAPLKELLPLIDAFNIDVKAFTEDFYAEHCAGKLKPVLRYVEQAAASAHVELTYLVVTGLNDNAEEMKRFSSWVAEINPLIPVHLSRYFPQHRFNRPPTPIAVMERLRETALQKLAYVYLGNVTVSGASDTGCPGCGEVLVRRYAYRVDVRLRDGKCPACNRPSDLKN
ncbi:MAG: AmmeMemoRadiSam system radical SAM enzyme [Bacillota bacterium]|jgi:pyruvate formate lyase activating enzyme|nr:AmmeMemoRadiSam system radical SAM enzyme [Bacillota bacterium]HHU29885.1 AmmeMemoRadiSam system radical SAM enzyme [Bacillota bacterium]